MKIPISGKFITKDQPIGLTILRMFLGLIIFYKSITFLRDIFSLKNLIESAGITVLSNNSQNLALVIACVGILLGLFIFLGLFTRLSCLFQIPVLFVATFFVNIKNINQSVFEFILSGVTLLLLILFVVAGSSKLSLDEFFRRGVLDDKNE
ncbi:MAG TPA: DoxX family membrane protein, partial [Puia sp.]